MYTILVIVDFKMMNKMFELKRAVELSTAKIQANKRPQYWNHIHIQWLLPSVTVAFVSDSL